MNLEKLAGKISDAQLKHPKKFILSLVIISLLSIPGIFLLLGNVEPSLEKVLPQNELKTMNDVRGEFGADMMFILIKADTIKEVTSPEALTYTKILADRIKENEFILSVDSAADLAVTKEGFIPKSSDLTNKILSENPLSSSLINHDKTLSIIRIRSDTGASAATIKQVVEQLEYDIQTIEELNPGLTVLITGFNSIDKATFEVIMKDFAFITGFSFLFMLIVLGLYFRDARKVFGAIITIATAVIITLGITGYLQITITVVTMVAAAMIMALGISYGINVTHNYYVKRKTNNKKDSLKLLNKEIIRALIASSLTTSAGFLALLAGVMPAMKNLGIVLALGITITLIISILFLPIITYKLERRKRK